MTFTKTDTIQLDDDRYLSQLKFSSNLLFLSMPKIEEWDDVERQTYTVANGKLKRRTEKTLQHSPFALNDTQLVTVTQDHIYIYERNRTLKFERTAKLPIGLMEDVVKIVINANIMMIETSSYAQFQYTIYQQSNSVWIQSDVLKMSRQRDIPWDCTDEWFAVSQSADPYQVQVCFHDIRNGKSNIVQKLDPEPADDRLLKLSKSLCVHLHDSAEIYELLNSKWTLTQILDAPNDYQIRDVALTDDAIALHLYQPDNHQGQVNIYERDKQPWQLKQTLPISNGLSQFVTLSHDVLVVGSKQSVDIYVNDETE